MIEHSLLTHKETNHAVYGEMPGMEDSHVKKNAADSEGQRLFLLTQGVYISF